MDASAFPRPRDFAIPIGLLLAGLLTLACVVGWPHAPGPPPDEGAARIISPTIYLPYVHHLSAATCKTMFPPEEAGGLCDYYDGINLPDECAPEYHMENQDHRPDGNAWSPLLTRRKVCHLNTARGERSAGLECETVRSQLTKGTP